MRNDSWYDPPEYDEDADGEEKTVVIPAMEQHHGIYTMRVTLAWNCPKCGAPRGEPFQSRSYDGSLYVGCDSWVNPCGHVDSYAAVREEWRQYLIEEERPERDED